MSDRLEDKLNGEQQREHRAKSAGEGDRHEQPDRPDPDVASAPAETAPAQERLQELERKAAERDEYLDLLQRVRADYANYQKRVQKEREAERLYASTPLVADLLNVVDNFERAIEAAKAEEASPGLLEGIRMIHHQLLDTLARHGVRPIEAQGLPFDPDVHEAVMKEQTGEVVPGTVVRVLQKGYKLHDRVVRPSKVVVAEAPEQPEPEQEQEPTDGRPHKGRIGGM